MRNIHDFALFIQELHSQSHTCFWPECELLASPQDWFCSRHYEIVPLEQFHHFLMINHLYRRSTSEAFNYYHLYTPPFIAWTKRFEDAIGDNPFLPFEPTQE